MTGLHFETCLQAERRGGGFAASCFASLWAFFVVASLLGFCFAVSNPVRQAMAPPLFGLRSIGAVLRFAYLAWSAGAVVGPILAGLKYELTGSYDLAFVLGGALLIIGALSVHMWGDHKSAATMGPIYRSTVSRKEDG